jgi:hypothetical protein
MRVIVELGDYLEEELKKNGIEDGDIIPAFLIDSLRIKRLKEEIEDKNILLTHRKIEIEDLRRINIIISTLNNLG